MYGEDPTDSRLDFKRSCFSEDVEKGRLFYIMDLCLMHNVWVPCKVWYYLCVFVRGNYYFLMQKSLKNNNKFFHHWSFVPPSYISLLCRGMHFSYFKKSLDIPFESAYTVLSNPKPDKSNTFSSTHGWTRGRIGYTKCVTT